MHSTFFALLPVFLAGTYVSAHGIVHDVTIAGKKYLGPDPNQGFRSPGASVIRQVLDTSPVQGAANAAMSCGTGAGPASEVADVNPGDSVAFNWGSWPHRVGPIITYLASCGVVSCDQFNSANARWFKIDQQGKKADGAWYQAGVADGQPALATIPNNLAPGNYLVRHEIIALHNALSVGGAEFYPSCTQIRVGGSGTGVPAESELVSFPGAYSDNDPGILVPDVYSSGQYLFPGPQVSKLGAIGGVVALVNAERATVIAPVNNAAAPAQVSSPDVSTTADEEVAGPSPSSANSHSPSAPVPTSDTDTDPQAGAQLADVSTPEQPSCSGPAHSGKNGRTKGTQTNGSGQKRQINSRITRGLVV